MKQYFIYLKRGKNTKTGVHEVHRMYYTSKLKDKDMDESMTFVGEAMLSDDYFIIGSETQHTSILDLNQVEFCYTATTKNSRLVEFSHTFQEMLERAKEGILPYISFDGHRVNRSPILRINGRKTDIKKRDTNFVID